MQPDSILCDVADILTLMAGTPPDMTQGWIYLACGWVGFALILRISCAVLGFQRASIPMSVLFTLLITGMIGAALAGIHRLYAIRPVGPFSEPVLLYAGLIGTLLILIIPLIMLVHKVNYLKSFIALTLSIMGAIGLIMLAQAGYKSIQTGEKGINKVLEHKKMTEEAVQ